MLAYTYVSKGKFALMEKERPMIQDPRDAVVRVTMSSICTSDLHIKHGSVPKAVPGITVGHEMVGVVEETGKAVTGIKSGDRVTVNVETYCGECFFCKKGFVNNCTDPNGGWALGCRIDGGPAGICTLLCVMLKNPQKIILCEKEESRRRFVKEHYPEVICVSPEEAEERVRKESAHGGADVVLEAAGTEETFQMAWKCARPNAIVTIVALYDKAQSLPLPEMYGKNLTFQTGGVDGCDCEEIMELIRQGKIDITPLLTHEFPLERIEEAYDLFENRKDNVIKVAIVSK